MLQKSDVLITIVLFPKLTTIGVLLIFSLPFLLLHFLMLQGLVNYSPVKTDGRLYIHNHFIFAAREFFSLRAVYNYLSKKSTISFHR